MFADSMVFYSHKQRYRSTDTEKVYYYDRTVLPVNIIYIEVGFKIWVFPALFLPTDFYEIWRNENCNKTSKYGCSR